MSQLRAMAREEGLEDRTKIPAVMEHRRAYTMCTFVFHNPVWTGRRHITERDTSLLQSNGVREPGEAGGEGRAARARKLPDLMISPAPHRRSTPVANGKIPGSPAPHRCSTCLLPPKARRGDSYTPVDSSTPVWWGAGLLRSSRRKKSKQSIR
jgi:hypothetical protein